MATNFDFNSILSPLDFEVLVRDLLCREFECKVYSYSEGPDQGIDLRLYQKSEIPVIVQCKKRKTISIKELEKERSKIQSLHKKGKASEYKIAFSGDLTSKMKDKIVHLFKPFLRRESDIFTRAELNQLLEKHPEVLKHHYKLWFHSSEVLREFFTEPISARSRALLTSIESSLSSFVRGASYDRAFDLLKKSPVLIISGIPGIGKTTLAKSLAWSFFVKGFEILEIRSLQDAEQVLREDPNRKQFLYFDDFLGENFLEYDAIKGRATALVDFLERILKSKNKVLVMTTREYILKQAQLNYAKLEDKKFTPYKYVLDLAKYSKVDKALILYNHLYYKRVPLSHVKALIKTRKYRDIINHENYNPRSIVHVCESTRYVAAQSFPEEFIRLLENPDYIWDAAFEREITTESRYLLFILYSIDPYSYRSILNRAYFAFAEKNHANLKMDPSEEAFKAALRELESSFITIGPNVWNSLQIKFHNPSVSDFILNKLASHRSAWQMLIRSALYFQQLLKLHKLVLEKQLDYEELIYDKLADSFNELILLSPRKQFWAPQNRKGTEFSAVEKLAFLARHFPDKIDCPKFETIRKLFLRHRLDSTWVPYKLEYAVFLRYDDVRNQIDLNETLQFYLTQPRLTLEALDFLFKIKNSWGEVTQELLQNPANIEIIQQAILDSTEEFYYSDGPAEEIDDVLAILSRIEESSGEVELESISDAEEDLRRIRSQRIDREEAEVEEPDYDDIRDLAGKSSEAPELGIDDLFRNSMFS